MRNPIPVVLLKCLLLTCLCGSTAATAQTMSDCGYYKMSALEFLETLDGFVDAIERQIPLHAELSTALRNRQNATHIVYESGLLRRIPDCNHGEFGLNVEVVGGNIMASAPLATNPTATASDGFTVIVRGLPTIHCQAARERKAGRTVMLVRPEPPGAAVGAVGECIGNPFPSLLARRVMPMPNTLYLVRQVALLAPVGTGMCQVNPMDQVAFDNAADDSACKLVADGAEDAVQAAQCRGLVEKVRAELTRQQSTFNTSQIAGLSAGQRLDLIRPLFESVYTPTDPALWRDRLQYLFRLYRSSPENNIDNSYWQQELRDYDAVAAAIRKAACDNRWDMILDEPALWKSLSEQKKRAILQDVYRAVAAVKFISIKQFYLEEFKWYHWIQIGKNGFYIPVGAQDYPAEMRDSVVIKPMGYHLGANGGYVSLQHALEVVLEELMHAHQYDLADQYFSGQVPVSSSACIQAPLFAYNTIAVAPSNFSNPLELLGGSFSAYESQPLEIHAKKFARHVAGLLLDGEQLQCH